MTAVESVRSWAGRLAGASAVASGSAYVAYFFAGPSTTEALVTVWNLLIIPPALYVGLLVARRGVVLAAISTVAGLAASLLWATSHEVARLEPWWIGLAAVWWLGLGWLLRQDRRALGLFTLALGVAAGVDFVLTALDAPMPIYALGGFKIPFTMIWSIWLGVTLLSDPMLGQAARTRPAR